MKQDNILELNENVRIYEDRNRKMCPHSDLHEMESVNNVPSISENVESERSENKTIVPFENAMTMTGKFNFIIF